MRMVTVSHAQLPAQTALQPLALIAPRHLSIPTVPVRMSVRLIRIMPVGFAQYAPQTANYARILPATNAVRPLVCSTVNAIIPVLQEPICKPQTLFKRV
jgi:hypothetical protein